MFIDCRCNLNCIFLSHFAHVHIQIGTHTHTQAHTHTHARARTNTRTHTTYLSHSLLAFTLSTLLSLLLRMVVLLSSPPLLLSLCLPSSLSEPGTMSVPGSASAIVTITSGRQRHHAPHSQSVSGPFPFQLIAINSLLRLRDGGLTAFYIVDTLLTQAACSQLQMKDSGNLVTNGLPCLDDVRPFIKSAWV